MYIVEFEEKRSLGGLFYMYSAMSMFIYSDAKHQIIILAYFV